MNELTRLLPLPLMSWKGRVRYYNGLCGKEANTRGRNAVRQETASVFVVVAVAGKQITIDVDVPPEECLIY